MLLPELLSEVKKIWAKQSGTGVWFEKDGQLTFDCRNHEEENIFYGEDESIISHATKMIKGLFVYINHKCDIVYEIKSAKTFLVKIENIETIDVEDVHTFFFISCNYGKIPNAFTEKFDLPKNTINNIFINEAAMIEMVFDRKNMASMKTLQKKLHAHDIRLGIIKIESIYIAAIDKHEIVNVLALLGLAIKQKSIDLKESSAKQLSKVKSSIFTRVNSWHGGQKSQEKEPKKRLVI